MEESKSTLERLCDIQIINRSQVAKAMLPEASRASATLDSRFAHGTEFRPEEVNRLRPQIEEIAYLWEKLKKEYYLR